MGGSGVKPSPRKIRGGWTYSTGFVGDGYEFLYLGRPLYSPLKMGRGGGRGGNYNNFKLSSSAIKEGGTMGIVKKWLGQEF